MNATERYMEARERMIKREIPIPPDVLRAHLDLQRAIIRVRGGHMHARTLVITRNAPGGDFAKDVMRLAVDNGWDIVAR